MRQNARMNTGVTPIAAPVSAQAADVRQRYGAPFGAAVTYSALVQQNLRVDPAAVIANMRPEQQPSQEKPRQSVRQQRLAEEEAAFDARRDAKATALGAHIDIEV